MPSLIVWSRRCTSISHKDDWQFFVRNFFYQIHRLSSMVNDALLLVAKKQSVTNQNLIPFAGLTEFSAVVFHAYTFNNALL